MLRLSLLVSLPRGTLVTPGPCTLARNAPRNLRGALVPGAFVLRRWPLDTATATALCCIGRISLQTF